MLYGADSRNANPKSNKQAADQHIARNGFRTVPKPHQQSENSDHQDPVTAHNEYKQAASTPNPQPLKWNQNNAHLKD